jgi:signal transduction histidine kinase/ligand-binding sensor domain-containing protein/DNA-binding response OmpR family regulator
MLAIPIGLPGQEKTSFISRPGDVLFENPLEKYNLPFARTTGYSSVMMQDSKGFLWLTCGDSFLKFDGYEFTDFLRTPVGPNDLNASMISVMAEDSHGFIWIGCYRKEGLFRYDPLQEKFERFPRNADDPQDISEAHVSAISVDRQGRVWIGTRGYGGCGMYMYDYASDRVTQFRHDPDDPSSLPDDRIHALLADRYGNIWISCCWDSSLGFYHFNPESGKFTEFRLDIPGKEPRKIFTAFMCEDTAGNLWFNRIGWYDTRENRLDHLFKVSDQRENLMLGDSDSVVLFTDFRTYHQVNDCNSLIFYLDGNIWADGEGDGFFITHPVSGDARILFPNTSYPYGPVNSYNLMVDSSGSIWYSSDLGIKRYVPWKRKFTSYGERFFNLPDNLPLDVLSAYEDPEGTLWMGINRSLFGYDLHSGKIREYIPALEPRTGYEDSTGNYLNAILPGDEGKLYIAGQTCFYIFDPSTGNFEEITHPRSAFNVFGRVPSFSMIQDKRGLIWIGTEPGCLMVDPVARTSAFLFEDSSSRFTGGDTYDLIEDRDGFIWMGTDYGLNRYDPLTVNVVKISHDPYKPGGLAAERISSLLQDRHGNLWIGYNNAGLSFLDVKYLQGDALNPDSLKFRHFSKEHGLPDLRITALEEDGSGRIWISTYLGLCRLDPPSGVFSQFNTEDGVHVRQFLSHFYRNPATGKILIGGSGGLISFFPDSIPLNSYIPPVRITGFLLHDRPVSISDTSVLRQSISYTENLDLAWNENFIEFKFAALDYTIPEKNRYKYFMEGVDSDTVYAGTSRNAVYRNLKPGKYTFWVTGSNNDGVWNQAGTRLRVTIHPPWYQSAAARSSYAAAFLLLVFAYIRWRTESVRKEKKALEKEVALRVAEIRQKNEQILEMEQMKTRFFTDVSHEIRTPLSLISGPLDALIKQRHPDPKTKEWLTLIRRNSQRLLQLVNQLLDISRLDAGHMKLVLEQSDPLKCLRILTAEFRSLAESRSIRFIIDVPETEMSVWHDREKVDKITTNLLSNAFKFTPENGTVTCRVKILKNHRGKASQQLRIIVADTGPGIPVEEREKIFERFYRTEGVLYEYASGTGIGLSITRELIRLLHGEVIVKSMIGTGAVFVVTIPLGIEHLKEDEFILKESGSQKPAEGQPKLVNGPDPAGQPPDVKEKNLVLVVEDNEDLRSFIRDSISDQFHADEAADGNEGLEKAIALIPDVVISDVIMPGMDGMEFLERLRNDERTSHIPVILLTAKATGKDKMLGLQLGAADYIFKPFEIDELKARIKNLLDQRERMRKKFGGMIGMDWDKLSVTTLDEKFIKKMTSVIAENLHDFAFDVGHLQAKMFISRQHLFRKTKALTGESPSGLIRLMRLKAAASFLEKGEESITKIALNTGFSNPSYFAQCFRERFGMTPKEYMNGHSGSDPI